MTQRRYEFSKAVKKEALQRSGKKCEATGARYGYPDYHRCNRDLSISLEFDHYPLPAYQAGSNTLENCVACCRKCNQHAANNTDKPRVAKERRVQDKHSGIKRVKQKIPSRGFQKFQTNARDINEDRP